MDELIGQQIGNYQLTRCLSQGGIVETYLGEHKHINMTAVVKILSIQLTEEQVVLFRHKAQPIAELMHKHIARLLDFDIQQDRPFLLQDYFPSGTLRKVHPHGTRVMLRQALSYAKRLADALHYTHSRQIVHGDVRPENVMLGWESNILLNDTGMVELVHTLAPDRAYPSMEAFAYLAPEQLQGQLLPASDQYALAVMIYEWLCGEMPFQGSLAEMITGHQSIQPPSLRTKIPEIPTEVEQVIMTALAKKPDERFASIQEFANALENASKSVLAVSSVPATPPPTLIDNHQVISPASLASKASLSSSELPTAIDHNKTIGAATDLTTVIDHNKTTTAETEAQPGVTPIQLSRRALFTTLAAGGIGVIAAAWAGSAAALNFMGTYSTHSTHRHVIRLIGKLITTYNETEVANVILWSPDGKRLVAGAYKQLQIWDITTGRHIAQSSYGIDTISLLRHDSNNFAWAGNKLYTAVIDTSNAQYPVIRVRDLVGNKEIFTYQWYANQKHRYNQPITPQKLALSPNGMLIASMEYDTGFRIWHASTGQDISQFQVQPSDDGITDDTILGDDTLAWAPDSRHVATWGQAGIIHIWDSSNGQMICSYRKHWDQHKNDQQFTSISIYMQWSPDSTRIASSVPTDSFEHSVDGVIHVWDARTGKEICSYNSGQPNDQLIDMEWSWDSKLIACVMNSAGGNARVTVWNASNGATVTTRAARSGGDNIAWHPQHYYIASTAQSITDQNNDNDDEYKVYIWDATTGKEFAQLHSNVYQALAWSPDGMQLAIGILNLDSPGTGAVQLWQIWQ